LPLIAHDWPLIAHDWPLIAQANQVAIAKAGGVPQLIMWLAKGGYMWNAKGGYNADAQREATSALLAMATNNEPLQGLISLHLNDCI
jgi:hypothetical protein